MNNNLIFKEFEESFTINDNQLRFKVENFPFIVNSFPREYYVRSIKSFDQYQEILNKSDFIIIDKKVESIYPIKNIWAIWSFYI